jgi:hypothetical protein
VLALTLIKYSFSNSLLSALYQLFSIVSFSSVVSVADADRSSTAGGSLDSASAPTQRTHFGGVTCCSKPSGFSDTTFLFFLGGSSPKALAVALDATDREAATAALRLAAVAGRMRETPFATLFMAFMHFFGRAVTTVGEDANLSRAWSNPRRAWIVYRLLTWPKYY